MEILQIVSIFIMFYFKITYFCNSAEQFFGYNKFFLR